MALDEALMRRAGRTGEGVFRVYTWARPTLSLGRNQRARETYDLDRARAAGVAFVRRPTGGRGLLHDHEVTYSATLPTEDAGDAAAAYGFVNGVLLAALGRIGVRAQLATGTTPIPVGPRPCFDAPSADEIVVGDRKLVGSAQWRRAGALLQHGSILVRDDQPRIAELMRSPIMPPSAATLAGALGREPEVAEVAGAIRESLEQALGSRLSALGEEPEMRDEAVRLRLVYEGDDWTWRR